MVSLSEKNNIPVIATHRMYKISERERERERERGGGGGGGGAKLERG